MPIRYDDAGRLTSETINGADSTFAYDPRGQLTTADRPAGADESYSWDAAGNPAAAAVDAGNRVRDDGTFTYGYDGEGNRTRKTDKDTGEYTTYEYDYRNRLTAATVYSAAGVVEHAYTATFDVFDRRIGFTADGAETWTV